jgi:hypothetical protein
MAGIDEHGPDEEVGRANRGALVFLGAFVIALMTVGSIEADNRLAAFGLTCYTASGLLAAPQLLRAPALAVALDKWLTTGPLHALGLFHARRKHTLAVFGYAQVACVIGGWQLRNWSQAVGWTVFVLGLILMAYAYVANMLFWASRRSSALRDGTRLDLVDVHVQGLSRRLGPGWLWVLAGLSFFAGTLLQYAQGRILDVVHARGFDKTYGPGRASLGRRKAFCRACESRVPCRVRRGV